jgi:hypothetical protein
MDGKKRVHNCTFYHRNEFDAVKKSDDIEHLFKMVPTEEKFREVYEEVQALEEEQGSVDG